MPITGLERTENLVHPSFQSGQIATFESETFSDEALLKECALGNQGALEELFRRYQLAIGRLLSQLLTSREDVEDALLGVFTRVWQSAPRFQYRARVSTWLYRIAVNLARDIELQRNRRPQQPWTAECENLHRQGNAEEEALQRLGQAEQARALQEALAELNPTDRLLLVLYYYEQMDYEEIQAITELSYLVLKTRLSRARQRLRRLLDSADRKAAL